MLGEVLFKNNDQKKRQQRQTYFDVSTLIKSACVSNFLLAVLITGENLATD